MSRSWIDYTLALSALEKSMLKNTIDHLIHNALPACIDYEQAEGALTAAHEQNETPLSWEAAARVAKRRAAELAIAVNGLTDCCRHELNLSLTNIRNDVSALCTWPGSGALRLGALERVLGVANAYKHQNLHDPTLPIVSDADILVVGLGFGLDGWGVGKYGGVEVLVCERDGVMYKFLGDAPVALAAWFRFLVATVQNSRKVPIDAAVFRCTRDR